MPCRSNDCPSPRQRSRTQQPPQPPKSYRLQRMDRGRLLRQAAEQHAQPAVKKLEASSSDEGAKERSPFLVGADPMTSPNGLSLDGRRKPPVFHFLKLSCALPSNGFRYTNQGSHIERGITLISLNSSWAALGRSPPRIVMVRRIISPRRSKPASASAHETIYETSGLEATTTCAPGTSFGSKSVPQVTKNACNSSSCSGDNVVNLGRGET